MRHALNRASGEKRRPGQFGQCGSPRALHVARCASFGLLRYVGALAILVMGMVVCASCKRRPTPGRQPSVPAAVVQAVAAGLHDGDLIFQESTSSQSEMVHALTGSRWTHMGVIFKEGSQTVVLEAVSPVRKTPLKGWIEHGRDGRYVVKRLRDADAKLPPAVIAKMRKLGATWLGRPYDLRFRWDDQEMYCSELAYKLFQRAADVPVGKLETAADMNLDDERVQRALRKRFANAKFNPQEPVVTPDSIFNDEQLVEVEL